jgi:hypothetical protein
MSTAAMTATDWLPAPLPGDVEVASPDAAPGTSKMPEIRVNGRELRDVSAEALEA